MLYEELVLQHVARIKRTVICSIVFCLKLCNITCNVSQTVTLKNKEVFLQLLY